MPPLQLLIEISSQARVFWLHLEVDDGGRAEAASQGRETPVLDAAGGWAVFLDHATSDEHG